VPSARRSERDQPDSRVEGTQIRWISPWQERRNRAAGFPDLLVAAVAERERVTVLHYDADYDLIAHVTGQPTQWIVPRGTVP
jgi:predicted nucleic acid-binding protein